MSLFWRQDEEEFETESEGGGYRSDSFIEEYIKGTNGDGEMNNVIYNDTDEESDLGSVSAANSNY